MKIIFMGTPDFAVPALQALIDSSHEVIAVYTQPPRPKGRGMEVHKSPVQQLAEKYNIDVQYPVSLKKDDEAKKAFASYDADVAVVAAYGLILPKEVLESPKHGCLNIHASLLPRWRGASPIQHAIWKGDEISGVTIMQMEEGLDTGPMILKGETAITSDTTAASLHDNLSMIGARLIINVIDRLARKGQIESEIQDHDLSTYAPMLKKSDGLIDETAPIRNTDQQIRALNPWPSTYVQGLKGRVKILEAHIESEVLVYDLVQPEGKKAMDYNSAVNGGYLE